MQPCRPRWIAGLFKSYGPAMEWLGTGGQRGEGFFYLFTFLLLRDEPAEKDNEETSHHIFPLETWQGIYLILPNLLS